MRVTKQIRLEQLGDELRSLPAKIEASLQQPLSLQRMEALAKAFCPVDTSALMESIRVERRGPHTSVLVAGGPNFINPRTGKPVDYAKPVHNGTSRMPARPFMLQAVAMEKYRLVVEMFRGLAMRF